MNRLLEIQNKLVKRKRKKISTGRHQLQLQPENQKALSLSDKVVEEVFRKPAYYFSTGSNYAGASSVYSEVFSETFYDWPDKLGTDATYDAAASKWIENNRAGVPDFADLKKTTSFKGGYSYNGKPGTDPKPDWKESDANKLKVYEAVRLELFGEGAANSINTYDDQIVTFGWGNSAKNDLGKKVIRYNMESSAEFKNAMLEMGLTVKIGEILYVDTVSKKLLKGTDALGKLRWDKKVLSKIITALDSISQINVNNQARIIKEERISKFPTETFSWPLDSFRLAFHLYHWLPKYLVWNKIKTSGGDVATIVRSFLQEFKTTDGTTRFPNEFRFSSLPNGAEYVTDPRNRLDMGNKAMMKAADAGKITRVEKSAFTDTYKKDPALKNYYFVEHGSHVYFIP